MPETKNLMSYIISIKVFFKNRYYLADNQLKSLLHFYIIIKPSFQDVSERFFQLMSNPIYYRVASKAFCSILNKRRFIVYR